MGQSWGSRAWQTLLASPSRSVLPVQRSPLPIQFALVVQLFSEESSCIESAPPVNLSIKSSVPPVFRLPCPLEISGPTADYIDHSTPTIEPEILKVQVSLVRTNEEIGYQEGSLSLLQVFVFRMCRHLLHEPSRHPSLPGPSTSPDSIYWRFDYCASHFLNFAVRFAFRPSFTRAW